MAFEGLSEKLNAAFKRLRGKGRLTENDVREAMREVRLALLEADVSYKVVKEFVATVTERSVGTDVLDSLTPAQQVVKIVNEELTNLMGGGTAKLAFANNGPTIVMMVGLQGAGKTTTTAKLAGYMKKFHSKRPLLAACDVYRPAAIEQLKVVGGQLGLPVFEEGQGDPVKIAENALRYARDHGNDLVFLDTAGRLHVDEALMDELKGAGAEHVRHLADQDQEHGQQVHDHGEDEHGRAADKGTNDHHKSILHIAHIGSQTGDQTSAAEFINIGEGVYLQMMKHIMPQIASKACRGACTAPAAQCTKSKRYQCKTH